MKLFDRYREAGLDDTMPKPETTWDGPQMNGHSLSAPPPFAPAPRRGDLIRHGQDAEHPGLITIAKGGWHPSLNGTLMVASLIVLAAIAIGAGGVSWHQQFVYIFHWKHDHFWSAVQALLLDAGAVGCALTALANARLRRRALPERIGVIVFSLASGLMNFFGADVASAGSIATYVGPPVVFAFFSDCVFRLVRHYALAGVDDDTAKSSAWRVGMLIFLYALRVPLAPGATLTGMRRWVLLTTPLPEKPVKLAGITLPAQDAPLPVLPPVTPPPVPPVTPPVTPPALPDGNRGPSKRQQLIDLMTADHDFTAITPEEASRLAVDYAGRVGYDTQTARREARKYAAALQNGGGGH